MIVTDTGIVHNNIEAAEFVRSGIDREAHLLRICDICSVNAVARAGELR
jgi:hypothetical protein